MPNADSSQNFVRVAAPLHNRLKKGEPTQIRLNDEDRRTVNGLKQNSITHPTLALPSPRGQFMVKYGACDEQVGFILQQAQESGKFRPLGY